MSNSDKVFVYSDNDKNISRSYLDKITKIVSGNSIFVSSSITQNLSCSIKMNSYTTTANPQHHAVIKNLCNIYSVYERNYTYTDNYSSFTVFPISKYLYGNKIVSGSFILDDNTNGLHLTDDGRGQIISGTLPVGKIFYSEGIVVITQSSLPTSSSTDYGIQFTGSFMMNRATINLEVPKKSANCSTNPTFYTTGSDGSRTRLLNKNEVFYDTIRLYNEHYELVGITKTSQPVKKSADESEIIRITYTY